MLTQNAKKYLIYSGITILVVALVMAVVISFFVIGRICGIEKDLYNIRQLSVKSDDKTGSVSSPSTTIDVFKKQEDIYNLQSQVGFLYGEIGTAFKIKSLGDYNVYYDGSAIVSGEYNYFYDEDGGKMMLFKIDPQYQDLLPKRGSQKPDFFSIKNTNKAIDILNIKNPLLKSVNICRVTGQATIEISNYDKEYYFTGRSEPSDYADISRVVKADNPNLIPCTEDETGLGLDEALKK